MRISDWSSDVCSSDLYWGRTTLRNLQTITGSPSKMLDALRPHELLECLVIPRLRQVVCEIDRRCLRAGVGEGQARDRHLEAEIDPHPFHEMALLFDRLRDQHSLFEPPIGDRKSGVSGKSVEVRVRL